MFVEPGAPDEADRIAELERRPQPRRPSAAHEAEMATVRAGQRFDDRRSLAVPADPDDKPLVAPFHGRAASAYEARRCAGGGTRASFRAMRSASADSAPTNAASPGHAPRVKTQPPIEPARLEPA